MNININAVQTEMASSLSFLVWSHCPLHLHLGPQTVLWILHLQVFDLHMFLHPHVCAPWWFSPTCNLCNVERGCATKASVDPAGMNLTPGLYPDDTINCLCDSNFVVRAMLWLRAFWNWFWATAAGFPRSLPMTPCSVTTYGFPYFVKL